MSDREYKELQLALKYFPLLGVPIVELANTIGVGYTSLYNFRNGVRPKDEKFRYIIAQMKEHYPEEVRRISEYIQIDREYDREAFSYGEWF